MTVLPNKTITMTRGDSEAIRVRVFGRDGTPRPLADGDVVEITVRKFPSDPEQLLHYVVTEFEDGAALISIDKHDTEHMSFGTYSYDVQLTMANGTRKTIIKPSAFIIGQEVTYDY